MNKVLIDLNMVLIGFSMVLTSFSIVLDPSIAGRSVTGAGPESVTPGKCLRLRNRVAGPEIGLLSRISTGLRAGRPGNRASEPDFGRILAGKTSKSALRPAGGRKSDFRTGFRPDSKREHLKIGPPAAGGPLLKPNKFY